VDSEGHARDVGYDAAVGAARLRAGPAAVSVASTPGTVCPAPCGVPDVGPGSLTSVRHCTAHSGRAHGAHGAP
jgi:hypothetical protein